MRGQRVETTNPLSPQGVHPRLSRNVSITLSSRFAARRLRFVDTNSRERKIMQTVCVLYNNCSPFTASSPSNRIPAPMLTRHMSNVHLKRKRLCLNGRMPTRPSSPTSYCFSQFSPSGTCTSYILHWTIPSFLPILSATLGVGCSAVLYRTKLSATTLKPATTLDFNRHSKQSADSLGPTSGSKHTPEAIFCS